MPAVISQSRGGSDGGEGFGAVGLADKTQGLIADWIDQVLTRD